MIAGGHGNENPNENWVSSRGFFVFYVIFVTFFHLILLSVLTSELAWSITNLSHNLAHLYFLHFLKGTPWISINTSENIHLETHWEQLDRGKQWSSQRKILTAIPIILFLLTCLYTKNNEMHFITNFLSLLTILVPKLPHFHHKRLFGINKY